MRTAQPWKTNRSGVLRANETSAEAKLWSELRGRRLAGLKFVGQAPTGRYFADFVCRERMIIVEVDGGTHSTDEEIAADTARQTELERLGFRVFRTWNDEIYDNIDGVIDALLVFVEEGA